MQPTCGRSEKPINPFLGRESVSILLDSGLLCDCFDQWTVAELVPFQFQVQSLGELAASSFSGVLNKALCKCPTVLQKTACGDSLRLYGEEKGLKTISVKTSGMWVKPPWTFSPYQPPYEEYQVTLVNAMWSRRVTWPTTPQIPDPQNYDIWLNIVVLRQEVWG